MQRIYPAILTHTNVKATALKENLKWQNQMLQRSNPRNPRPTVIAAKPKALQSPKRRSQPKPATAQTNTLRVY